MRKVRRLSIPVDSKMAVLCTTRQDSPGRHVNDVEHSAADKHSNAFSEGSALTPVQTETGAKKD